MSLKIGDAVPDFSLPDTGGELHAPDGRVTVVVFTCNHCPYALAWHDRIMQVAREYDGVHFLAINPNDAERYPGDSYEAMKQRVANEDWPVPYLRDESQEVARAFGARTTPDLFVFDAEGRLRYRGAPDPDHREPSHDAVWLREALDAVLRGEQPQRAETEPVGCSVKWRQ